jgi:hypothetical protein
MICETGHREQLNRGGQARSEAGRAEAYTSAKPQKFGLKIFRRSTRARETAASDGNDHGAMMTNIDRH